MTEAEEAYNAMIENLMERVGKLSEAEAARSLALLDDMRRKVSSQVMDSDWKSYYVPRLKESVARAAEQLRQRYESAMKDASVNFWNVGLDQVDWPLNYVGIAIQAPEISRTALEIMQGYSADLVTNLVADARTAINREISLGILGGKSPWDVMQAIGRNLKDPGVYRNIALRAETITRTELARVNSVAREARIREVVQANPDLDWQKKWLSSGKYHPRPNHVALHGVVVPLAKDFSKFGGRGPVDKGAGIPYPHAPGLPASEVVNCGCGHALTLADWEAQGPKKPEEIPYQPRAIWD